MFNMVFLPPFVICAESQPGRTGIGLQSVAECQLNQFVRAVLISMALAWHPHLGRPGREPETRELIVAGTAYIIPYRIHRERLAFLAVLHAAQDRPEE
jgi:hypothetical protein